MHISLPGQGQVPASIRAHGVRHQAGVLASSVPRPLCPVQRLARGRHTLGSGQRQTFSHAVGELPFVTSTGFVLHDATALRLSENKLSRIGVA